jgi:hypothetical protein
MKQHTNQKESKRGVRSGRPILQVLAIEQAKKRDKKAKKARYTGAHAMGIDVGAI